MHERDLVLRLGTCVPTVLLPEWRRLRWTLRERARSAPSGSSRSFSCCRAAVASTFDLMARFPFGQIVW